MPRTVCTNSGLAGLLLDLAAQPVDLHVDGAFRDCAAIAGERQPRHGLSRRRRQDAQHLALAVGQPDDFLAFAQFTARQMIDERPEADGFHRRRGSRLRTLEDIGDAQRKLSWFKWFRQIIVGAHLEALDAALGGVARGQHQDRHARRAAQRFGEVEAVLARHHHVENKQIEAQPVELGARVGGGLGGGDAIALARQKA